MGDFNWNDLQAFLTMARAGRLTVAAQRLGVDHSTLSRRIAALEAALGVPLFERRAVGFVLTPEGERLIGDAEAIETLALRMRATLDDGAASLTGTVRIGTPEGFGTYFLAPRIERLTGAHPGLEIELVANPRSFSLTKREADLAVSMARPAQGRVYAKKLVDYALGLYAAPAYLERKAKIRKRADLAGLHWIGYVEDLMWTPELDYLPQVSREISAHLRVSNVITQMMALAGGAGIGVLPHFMARNEPGLVRVLPDEVRLTRSYWLVTHADTRDLARVERVTQFMREQLREAGEAFWMA
ncbi:LysR family transcriptional regulator [Herbaspirillum robiniae]|uniref:LysR family transcriptional regulator n=1 Tax=Herbaspirillum robiniae TaxID=2014887 RepID=A0A246WK35_9BURK|nr:LysR family transcriptional regulator [Herbaspirillum robiniae]NUU01010.1 LysR family transcriptional regulator [Herbaspirillum robiniae]OWY26578.1 LysR family transcriptional regulator [Herbaspirillum robiniae]